MRKVRLREVPQATELAGEQESELRLFSSTPMLFSEDSLLANFIMLYLGSSSGLCVPSSLAIQDLELTLEMSSGTAPLDWKMKGPRNYMA